MLLAMGAMAMRHGIDLSEARIDTTITATDKPIMRFQSIDVQVVMPGGLSASQRTMLERAAEGCPIKHSFGALKRLDSYSHRIASMGLARAAIKAW